MISIKDDFYVSRPVMEIHQISSRRGGLDLVREAILLRILSFCSNGATVYDYKAFSFQDNPNQTKLVWDYCISAGILRETENGYSAMDWLKENGLIDFCPSLTNPPSNGNASNLPPSARKRGRPPKDTTPHKDPPKEGQILQINGIPETGMEGVFPVVENIPPKPSQTIPSLTNNQEEQLTVVDQCKQEELDKIDQVAAQQPIKPQEEIKPIDETKEAVRPNVFLTRSEILDLKTRFTDDQIKLMLDKLSEYKATNKRYYKSDFDAIERWVIRWLDDSTKQQKSSVIEEFVEFPSGLTGK